jgi:hypothetical protein
MSHKVSHEGILSDRGSVILKVLLLSASLSVLIKYGAPSLHISTTNLKALITVLLPSGVMTIALGWRAWKTGFASKAASKAKD